MGRVGGILRRPASAVACAVAFVLLAMTPAAAHDELVSTDPADGATVDVAPDQVVLTFTRPALELGTEVLVTGPDGAAVSEGPARLVDATVVQPLAASRPAGAYRVDWRVTSEDGHPISGTFAFTAAGAVPAAEPTTVAPTTGAPTSTPEPTDLAAAPIIAPTDAAVAPPDDSESGTSGRSTGKALAVLAVVAALLVAVRLGRAASLRRKAAAASSEPTTPLAGEVGTSASDRQSELPTSREGAESGPGEAATPGTAAPADEAP